MTERAPSDLPDASFIFRPENDLSLILEGFIAGGAARDVSLDLADQNCRNAGHRPVRTLDNADKTRETRDDRPNNLDL